MEIHLKVSLMGELIVGKTVPMLCNVLNPSELDILLPVSIKPIRNEY